jgi:hypothetical protein
VRNVDYIVKLVIRDWWQMTIYDCSIIYKLWIPAISRCAISYCDNRYSFSHFRNNWPQSHLFSYFISVSINGIPKQLSLFSNRCYLLYDKIDDFAFLIINLPFISRYITAASAYRAYISQLTRYSRVCNFLEKLSSSKINSNKATLKTSLQQFYGCQHELVDCYEISQMAMGFSLLRIYFFILLPPIRLLLTGLDYEQHGGCLIRNRNDLPFASS